METETFIILGIILMFGIGIYYAIQNSEPKVPVSQPNITIFEPVAEAQIVNPVVNAEENVAVPISYSFSYYIACNMPQLRKQQIEKAFQIITDDTKGKFVFYPENDISKADFRNNKR